MKLQLCLVMAFYRHSINGYQNRHYMFIHVDNSIESVTYEGL